MSEIEHSGFEGRPFQPATGDAHLEVENPTTGERLASVSAAQRGDVDTAVAAAQAAFKGPWHAVSPAGRGRLLNKLTDLIERDAYDLAGLEALDAGIVFGESKRLHIPQACETLRYFAGGYAFTRREPLGVCAAVVPWNAPLMITIWKLGGKGASIVFADADLDNALFWTATGITAHNWQVCAAGSRIYIHAKIYDVFLLRFAERLAGSASGDLLASGTTKGPVINARQREKILAYIQYAKEAGIRQVAGDNALPAGGLFVPNSAFVDVPDDARIMREEIFGPVASIAKFNTEAEVIEKANATEYGLSAAVFTNDVNRAQRVSEALKSGQVTVNCWGLLHANTPFGAGKQSGFGRDMGEEALEGWMTT
ncbi:Aldehyde/histidinol dehydrogenase [Staphylotrichum tortipilum]|uniref:aldehyde dehydrogenase (NAD(+)) n=1 Tax=Staphylotrichum tortipilum TaxID=2831512 RepID=A0AAN6MIC3_9PEZI|nr:Aldehyde/histidinol dehydrogenase [Staphylotrichum longicolle]